MILQGKPRIREGTRHRPALRRVREDRRTARDSRRGPRPGGL